MDDENIIWKEIGAIPFLNEQKKQAVVEPCKMGSYPSLYVELKEKCNPQNYMSPYNKEKVDMANELYKELLNTPQEDNFNICRLRDKAMQGLIVISTQKVYQELIEYCDPQKFMDPYDFDAVQLANHYYPLVEEFRNDIHVLEKLHKDIFQDKLLKAYYKKKEYMEHEKMLEIQEKERLEYIEEGKAAERSAKKGFIIIVVVIVIWYFMTII